MAECQGCFQISSTLAWLHILSQTTAIDTHTCTRRACSSITTHALSAYIYIAIESELADMKPPSVSTCVLALVLLSASGECWNP